MRVLALLATAASSAALAAPAAPPATPDQPPPAHYTVKAGDTLYALSRKWFPAPGALERVRRLNHIANVHRLPVTRILTIPRALLADEPGVARVESFSGEVTVTAQANTPARAVTAGLALGEGALLRTGRGGFVSLRLADDSVVTLPSQSTVRLVRLRRVLMTGAVERTFMTESGRLRARVTPMTDPGSTFEVRTPLTVSAVRGTAFRANYDDKADFATTEVEEGKVAFIPSTAKPAAAKAAALVPAGFGALSTRMETGAPTALIAAPRLIDPDKVQTDPELAFAVEPEAEAAIYHVQLARDAGLTDLVGEADAKAPALTLPGLPTGTYFARVSATAGNGLEGLARTYTFDRVLNSVAGGMGAEGAGFERRYRFKWSGAADGVAQYRFQLARKDDPAHPLVDEPLGTATALAVTSLPPGEYAWRVLSIVPRGDKVIASWSGEQSFEVSVKPARK